MVAPNKKKRNNSNKSTESQMIKKEDKITSNSTSEMDLVEKNVGATLLTGVNVPPKPTKELLKGKDLVGLYFGASWSAPSQSFTPTLIDFYQKCGKPNRMEIIYVSSDNTREEFHSELEKMPWLAIDGDQEGTMLKHALATNLKAYKIPTLVILNLKTGNFVSDLGRKEILALLKQEVDTNDNNNNTQSQGDFTSKGNALLETWKTMDPIAIGHNTTPLSNVENALDYFTRNPIMAAIFVAILVFSPILKRVMNNPLLGFAFCIIFKRWTKEPLSRNEPYMIQESSTTSVAKEETQDKKKQ